MKVVHHIDGNPLNNALSNLLWAEAPKRAKKRVTCCATCGQIIPPTVTLPKMRQRIYDCVAAKPQGISVDEIASLIYADDPQGGPDNAPVCIRTQIYFINSKCLRALGLEIHGKSGPQGLYRLVEYRA